MNAPQNPNDPNQTHTETVREREVIVTGNEGRSSAANAIVAVVAILAAVIIGWLIVTNLDSTGIEVPDEINVNVDDNSGGGDAEPEA